MKFFKSYSSTPMISPLIDNENDFATIRRRLLNKPTIAEYQIGSRIAMADDKTHNDTVRNPLAQTRADKESKWLKNLIIHYTHEKRLQNYKKDIRLLWNQTFEKTPIIFTKLIIGNRNSPNMTQQLVRRRPTPKQNKIIHKT